MRCLRGAKPALPVGRKVGGYWGAHWVPRKMPHWHLVMLEGAS